MSTDLGFRPQVSLRERIKQGLRSCRNLILVMLALLALITIHLGASPWERALGLAHGQIVITPNTEFLVFDHLTAEGTEVLNRNLFHHSQGAHELVVVSGYGLWRFGILLAITYGLILYLGRALIKARTVVSTKLSVDRRFLVLYCMVFGVGLAILDVRNVAPTLFALAFLNLLILSNEAVPHPTKVANATEILTMTRALWLGWLLPQMMTWQAGASAQTTVSLIGLLLGFSASYLSLIGLEFWQNNRLHNENLVAACKASFELGCWETLAFMALGVSSYSLGPEYLAGTLLLTGAFGYGRFAQSLLVRRLATLEASGPGARLESACRVAAGVWFLLPLVVGPFFQGYDQTALMLWLSGLVPLLAWGRPWGSPTTETNDIFTAKAAPEPEPSLSSVRPTQKTAILFMSLPPEQSAELFSELSPAEVQAITLEITRLPAVSPELREAVLNEFLQSHVSPRARTCFRSIDILEKRMKENPAQVAAGIRNAWLPPDRNSPEVSAFQRSFLSLTQPQKAAILFMSLPPEVSAQLFAELGPEMVQAVTLEITQLPSVAPWVREAVMLEFMERAQRDQGTLHLMAEALTRRVKTNPAHAADDIKTMMQVRQAKKIHVCLECGDPFKHGIGLRKHQRQTGHKASRVLLR